MNGLIFAILLAVMPSCEFEDSPNCKWDASEMGNGQGVDFIDIGGRAFYRK